MTTDGSRLLIVERDQIDAHPDAIDHVIAGERLGLVARGVLSPETCADLVRGFDEGRLAPTFEMRHYGGRSFGPTAVVWPGALDQYFEAAATTNAGLEAAGDPFGRIAAALGALAGGRAVEPARDRVGRAAATLNARELRPGADIKVHCENETRAFETMRWLDDEIARTTILSFYVPLALPESGGELHVLPLRHGEASGAPMLRIGRVGEAIDRLLASVSPTVPDVGAGDLLVFDAGHYYHRVTPVLGSRSRWTMGAFVALARTGARLLAWT